MRNGIEAKKPFSDIKETDELNDNKNTDDPKGMPPYFEYKGRSNVPHRQESKNAIRKQVERFIYVLPPKNILIKTQHYKRLLACLFLERFELWKQKKL